MYGVFPYGAGFFGASAPGTSSVVARPTTPYVTLAEALTAISARLGDPANVRFAQAELTCYLQEAIRTFNALTGHFRDVGVFQTAVGEPFYSLPSVLPSLRGYSVTDIELTQCIEYSLLEPPTPTSWTGTDMFTLDDVVSALQRRRDQFLLETGMVVTRSTPTITPAMGGRFALSSDIVTVRRAAFQNVDGVMPLHREDVWAFNHYNPPWVQNPGRPPADFPFAYSIGETPPLVIQIVPPPSDRGTLDLLSVQRGVTLDTTAGGVTLGVPDDWSWGVKWGALADLLNKDGLAQDPARASYCEQRWQQAVDLGKMASVVWSARVNDVPVLVTAVAEADQFLQGWQGTTGQPDTALLSGGNLVALSAVPDGVYGVTLDLVVNAPVPSAIDDVIQLGPEWLDAIYGYVIHLCLFKEGIQGVQDTQGLLEQFFRMAGVEFSLETASTPNRSSLVAQAQQENAQTPRLEMTR